jgi:hypothetical protein
MAIITDQNAAHAGWHYDTLHQQPVYLLWDQESWRARFVWQDPLAVAPLDQGGSLSVNDEPLTPDMYHRLIPLGQAALRDYTSTGGCAIRDLYGMRRLVQVKPAVGGQGVFIQAPAVADQGQCDHLCQVIWLADDEIPTIIRALQARRRAVLEPGRDGGSRASEDDA